VGLGSGVLYLAPAGQTAVEQYGTLVPQQIQVDKGTDILAFTGGVLTDALIDRIAKEAVPGITAIDRAAWRVAIALGASYPFSPALLEVSELIAKDGYDIKDAKDLLAMVSAIEQTFGTLPAAERATSQASGLAPWQRWFDAWRAAGKDPQVELAKLLPPGGTGYQVSDLKAMLAQLTPANLQPYAGASYPYDQPWLWKTLATYFPDRIVQQMAAKRADGSRLFSDAEIYALAKVELDQLSADTAARAGLPAGKSSAASKYAVNATSWNKTAGNYTEPPVQALRTFKLDLAASGNGGYAGTIEGQPVVLTLAADGTFNGAATIDGIARQVSIGKDQGFGRRQLTVAWYTSDWLWSVDHRYTGVVEPG
jgi:hypothetical protein